MRRRCYLIPHPTNYLLPEFEANWRKNGLAIGIGTFNFLTYFLCLLAGDPRAVAEVEAVWKAVALGVVVEWGNCG